MAASHGDAALVELLLDLDAPIDWSDQYDFIPLLVATWAGHETVVKILLKRGANIHSKDSQGHTALFQAAMHGRESLIKPCSIAGR